MSAPSSAARPRVARHVGRRLLSWKVWGRLGDVELVVKGRDEADARSRFIDAILRDPDIALRGLEFQRVDPAPIVGGAAEAGEGGA